MENSEKHLVKEEDLMSQEELEAWRLKSLLKDLGLEDDPLDLLGSARGKNMTEQDEKPASGPDDGDSL